MQKNKLNKNFKRLKTTQKCEYESTMNAIP